MVLRVSYIDDEPIDRSIFEKHVRRNRSSKKRTQEQGKVLAMTPQHERGYLSQAMRKLFSSDWYVTRATYEFAGDVRILLFYLNTGRKDMKQAQQLAEVYLMKQLLGKYAFGIRVYENPDSTILIDLRDPAPSNIAKVLNGGESLLQLRVEALTEQEIAEGNRTATEKFVFV